MYASQVQSSTASPCSRDYQSVASSEAVEQQSAGGPGSGTGPESLKCSVSGLEGTTSQQTVSSCADSNLARTFAARGSPLLAGGRQDSLQVSVIASEPSEDGHHTFTPMALSMAQRGSLLASDLVGCCIDFSQRQLQAAVQ